MVWQALILAALMIVSAPVQAEDPDYSVPAPTEDGPCNIVHLYLTAVPPYAELHEECIWQLA